MAAVPDPYRVLELQRGATLDEIKRAYRRLAKQHHPDSGGERALPRFLEIQAAYEQLLGPAGGSRRAPAPRAAPWQADDVRAEATKRAYGSRTRRPTGRSGTAGDAGTGRAGPAGAAGAAGASGAPNSSAGRDAGTGGSTAGDAGPRAAAGGRRDRGPRRGRSKATLGSTSYDGAEDEPFEPGWTGASWYGTTSGTYWTLNPKEYADPRKHGPEYQARARRRGADPRPDPELAGARAGAEPMDQADGPAAVPGDPAGPTSDRVPGADTASSPGSGWAAAPETGPGATWSARPRPRATARRRTSDGWHGGQGDAGDRRNGSTSGGSAGGSPIDPFDPGAALSDVAGAVLREPSRPLSRLALAVAGGAPIGLGLAWLLGEITGCGRFSATCDPGVISFAWLAALVIIAAFVVLPAAASIATFGTLSAFAAGIPATVLLSATGGARLPEASSAVLGVILVVGWLMGVVYGIARRRGGAAPVGPVS